MNFDRLRWVLIPAIASHNFEEWVSIPYFREGLGVSNSFATRPWQQIEFGLLMVTVVPAAIIFWASTGARRQYKDWSICWIASIFFTNVFVPHVPASILELGYTPGIGTALLVLLPVCLWLFRLGIREERLTKTQFGSSMLIGAISLPLAILLTFEVAELLT